MSLFAEFHVPSADFALFETLDRLPDLVVEIDRVAAADELLTPYFWVSAVEIDEFEAVAEGDPSIEDLRRLDDFESASLYRATWTENVDTMVYASTQAGATILEAKGQHGVWDIRIRFDDRDPLEAFQKYAQRFDISFDLVKLYETEHPRTGSQYGLTEKQHEALNTAWELGYFEEPREATLAEVAAELDITRQSLSQRLRRGHHALVANTIRVTPLAAEKA
ncbi:helix-turn-helix domain-containing protein [Halosimplex pelagicum]|uniref:Helix-turn-helix domain-containing protein n=1 Tax=Halosimplex pelagicum TaxID=869886 RepID=A0A7D5SX20_9EURY|nr:helix-turn-helix domain-containing protein [Halosimplex pelagicum]QLH83507.1 helix-turn-helix domain-containing protein [Halosimplex pelagicum]